MSKHIISITCSLLLVVFGGSFAFAAWNKKITHASLLNSQATFSSSSIDWLTPRINLSFQNPYSSLLDNPWDSNVLKEPNTSKVSEHQPSAETSEILYPVGTIVAEFVDTRSEDFSGFEAWSCTVYIAKHFPELFLSKDGTRRLTWNAADWPLNAQKLGLETWTQAKVWSIAVFAPWVWAWDYGHVAIVQDIQSDWTLIVSEMNFEQEFVVTYRVVASQQVALYIY